MWEVLTVIGVNIVGFGALIAWLSHPTDPSTIRDTHTH